MDQFYQLGSDLVQGQDKINITGLDRSLRHAEILRRGPVLSDDLAALLLDDLHSERTVTISPRKDCRNGIPFVNLGHRSKQRLGGRTGIMNFVRRGRGKPKATAFGHKQMVIGRRYKNTRMA